MTEQRTKYRYVKRLIIPNLLWDIIKDMDEAEQFNYSFIPSFIKSMVDTDNHFQNINIGRKVWLNVIGTNYRTYIDNLILWDVISIQSFVDGTEAYKQGKHCKCYSITNRATSSGFTVKNYNKKQPKTRTTEKNIKVNSIDTTDPIINYSLQSITNTFSIQNKTKPIISVEQAPKVIKDDYWLDKLTYNNYSIHYGKNCGRLYHPIICMSKVARQTVWFKDSDTVADYDVKSCFPVLLFKVVDTTEKTFYKYCLDDDIYNSIIKDTKYSRDECKVAFQQFINGFITNFVYYWFRKYLPKTFQVIEKNYKTMAKTLQQAESDIMIKTLIPFCITNNIGNVITCHDGWMTPNTNDETVIIEQVKTLFYNYCGYIPTVNKTIRNKTNPIISVEQGIDFKELLRQSNVASPKYNQLTMELVRTKTKVDRARKQMFQGGSGYDRVKYNKWKSLKMELETIQQKLDKIQNN